VADFELEQLATLLDRLSDKLGDRLDETTGDERIYGEIFLIRKIIQDASKQTKTNNRSEAADRKDTKTILSDLASQLARDESLKNARQANQKDGKDRPGQTIISELKQEREARSASIKRIKDFSDTIQKSTGSVISSFSKLDGTANGLAKALGAGAAAQALASGIDGNIDAYRDLIASAEGSVSGLIDMRRTAEAAGMSVETLGKAMKEGSDAVRLLGAKDWSKFNKNVRDATLTTGLLGMSQRDMIAAQSTYLEMLREMGDLNSMSTDEQSDNFRKLISTTQEVAGILGKTRDDQLKAMKEQATDYDMTTIMDSIGMTGDAATQMQAAMSGLKDLSPQVEKAMKEVLIGGGPQTDASKNIIAAGGEPMQRLMERMIDARNSGQVSGTFAKDILAEFKDGAKSERQNKDMSYMRATLSNRGMEGMGSVNQAYLRATDLNFNKANPDQSKEKDPGTAAMLALEDTFNRIKAAGNSLITTVLEPLIKDWGPKLLDLIKSIVGWTDKIQSFSLSMKEYPTLMTAIGVAAIGLLGGFKLLGLAIKPIIGLLKMFGGKLLPGALGKAAGSAGSILGGVARGAGAGAASGAGRAGGTIIGGLKAAREGLGRLGSTGVGKIAGTAGKGLLKGGLGFGAAIESLDYLFGDKKFTAKNLTKSGLSLAGGALGGLGGSLLGPLGTVAGGAGGYTAGKALGDWMLGPDDVADASKDKEQKGKQNQTAPQNKTQKPADASRTPGRGQSLSLDQMTNKIMEANVAQVEHLKHIRQSSDAEVKLLRDEISLLTSFNDRIIKLLEEGNKNTRNISDLSA
jgi:hypothetical protein